MVIVKKTCVEWLRDSKWSKVFMISSILVGLVIGVGLASINAVYEENVKPKTAFIESATIHESNGTTLITADIKSTFGRTCNKFSGYYLNASGTNNSFPLWSGPGGQSFRSDSLNYTITLPIPNYIPTGDYDFTIRTIYMCNFFGLTMNDFSETIPYKIHIN